MVILLGPLLLWQWPEGLNLGLFESHGKGKEPQGVKDWLMTAVRHGWKGIEEATESTQGKALC